MLRNVPLLQNESTLFTTQYKTKPEGKYKNNAVKTTGINNISFSCVGSREVDSIFVGPTY